MVIIIMDPNNSGCSLIPHEDFLPSIQKLLQKSKTVDIKGMAHSAYFLTPPTVSSTTVQNGHGNDGDISMLLSLYSYLQRQGYGKDEMIILALGEGQVKAMNKVMAEHALQGQIRTANTFEGNGLGRIVLALVDSHYYGSHQENRTSSITEIFCQLIFSLTQQNITAVYIVGDEKLLLASDSALDIIKLFRGNKLMGSELHLKCVDHSTLQSIRFKEDFPSKGGCFETCQQLLLCGHVCYELCHPAFDHTLAICVQACGRSCDKGHPCPLQCHAERSYNCEPCQIEVTKTFLNCPHKNIFKCCDIKAEDLLKMECPLSSEFVLPCKHKIGGKCNDRGREKYQQGLPTCTSTNECLRFVAKKLPCGHPKALRCSQSIEGAKCLTTVPIVRPLECGHFIRAVTKCYKRDAISPKKSSKKCALPCPMILECGHECQFEREGVKFYQECQSVADHSKKHPCMRSCTRQCSNKQHICREKHSCQQACPPCTQDVTVIFDYCNHKRTMPCQEFNTPDAKRCNSACTRPRPEGCEHLCPIPCRDHIRINGDECPPCKEMVTRRRDCNHKVQLMCGQPIRTTICEEMVDLKDHSACEHSILVKCYVADEIASAGDSNLYCKSQCNYYFKPTLGGCGHPCPGKCSSCALNRFHEPCREKCGKLLFCGHECKGSCASTCPPCEQNCETACEHEPCGQICALPCKACMKPCSYSCSHGKCTKKCSEVCDKKPCMVHCPKSLKCGHLCSGYCGEICPQLCTICDAEELLAQDFIGKAAIEQTDRFITLVDCGHTIDAESLELHMTTDVVDYQTLPKKCPVLYCGKDIRNCNRYKGVILKIRGDIEKIKNKIYGYPMEIRRNHEAAKYAINQVHDIEAVDCGALKELKKRIVDEMILKTPFDVGSCRYFQKMSLGKAQCLAFVANLCLASFRILQEAKVAVPSNRYKFDLKMSIDHFIGEVTRRPWPLTAFELRTVEMERDRIEVVSKLYRKTSEGEPEVIQHLLRSPIASEAFENAVWQATKVGPYDEKRREEMSVALKSLEAALECKLGITDEERKSIVKSFDLAPGRWFKCANGHPYIIANCGAPTQTFICHECNDTIGGTNHMLMPSNQLASEMDGAVAPLYPTVLTRDDFPY